MSTTHNSDSSSSDEDNFQLKNGVSPHMFEPNLSPAELEARKQRQREKRELASTIETIEGDSMSDRKSNKLWCTCGLCATIPSLGECICCHEVPIARGINTRFEADADVEGFGEETTQEIKKCVTQHPDFVAHLKEGVLDTYFRSHQYNWKKFPKPRGPRETLTNAQYRLVAYRFILDWLLQGERLEKRIPLPACVVNSTRAKYPADDNEYSGFKYAELPTI